MYTVDCILIWCQNSITFSSCPLQTTRRQHSPGGFARDSLFPKTEGIFCILGARPSVRLYVHDFATDFTIDNRIRRLYCLGGPSGGHWVQPLLKVWLPGSTSLLQALFSEVFRISKNGNCIPSLRPYSSTAPLSEGDFHFVTGLRPLSFSCPLVCPPR